MPLGSITDHIDLPETMLVLFFIGFLGVVWFLRRLDKREGYPMKASLRDDRPVLGFPMPPDPKTYLLLEGGTSVAPHYYEQPPMQAVPLYPFDGSPLTPTGNPLLAAIGPGAWVMRRDEPMLTENGELMLAPLRDVKEWYVENGEADPRGMMVFDRRWVEIGIVRDVWVDRSAKILRLLEIELRDGLASGPVLVPIFHSVIDERAREVRVTALEAHQFADLPMPGKPNQLTAREDERLNAYFAAGYFYRDTEATFRPAGFEP